ncbi:MAG TPA: hypothetical protein VFL42_02915 [Terriglobales bacterium]|nr:hypothetical protein [Terriglobales bacterium]
MKLRSVSTAIFLVCAILLTGCGGQDRLLQSIVVSGGSTTPVPRNGTATFTASGQFNMAPMKVDPVAVSWAEFEAGLDQIPGSSYSLSSQPLTITCFLPGIVTVVAFAPANPKAPATGTVPTQVYQDLVGSRTMSAEGGFVATTAQITCQ